MGCKVGRLQVGSMVRVISRSVNHWFGAVGMVTHIDEGHPYPVKVLARLRVPAGVWPYDVEMTSGFRYDEVELV